MTDDPSDQWQFRVRRFMASVCVAIALFMVVLMAESILVADFTVWQWVLVSGVTLGSLAACVV